MDLPGDTSREARDGQIAAYRAMTGAQRVAIAFEMSEAAVALTRAGLRDRHPEWTEDQVGRKIREILLGPELARRVEEAPVPR